MKITEAEISSAAHTVALLQADLDEARNYAGCEALVAMLTESLAPLAEVLAHAGQRREMLHVANL